MRAAPLHHLGELGVLGRLAAVVVVALAVREVERRVAEPVL